jgi:CRP-like cAMP-binding protein
LNILEFINKNLALNLIDYADLPFSVTHRKFSEFDVITDYGKIENHVYFLKKGIVQISLNYNEDERIFDFIEEGNFLGSYSSLLTRQPSDVKLTALTNVDVEIINYNELLHAYSHSLLANQLGRLATERVYVSNTKREKDFLIKSAEQRYQDLIENRSNLIALLPVHKIAKYLAIQPESLSRIRKQIIS